MDKSEKYTDSSKKIEHIVRKVLELKRSDPNVKILIFSQWSDILNTLKNELLANDVPSRNVVNTTKSLQQMVDEFKVYPRCLCLVSLKKKLSSLTLSISRFTGSSFKHNVSIDAIQIWIERIEFDRSNERVPGRTDY